MVMPSPAEFYTGSHVRTLFRALGPFYSSFGHRGQDFAGWPGGTPIPAYRAGTVVADFWGPGLGNQLVIEYSDGKFGGFCHMQARSTFKNGDTVEFGDTVGLVGQTGTLSDGDHLHATLSPVSKDPGQGAVEDPLPYIHAAIIRSETAALNETPLIITIPKDDDMTVYLKPTDNSSPLSDGISRIWTGYRTIAGIDYADVWGVDGNGTARRLTAVQWRILNALPKTAITLNVVEVTGNELEQIVFAPSF